VLFMLFLAETMDNSVRIFSVLVCFSASMLKVIYFVKCYNIDNKRALHATGCEKQILVIVKTHVTRKNLIRVPFSWEKCKEHNIFSKCEFQFEL
jgi:hypothetical protein